MRSFAKKSNKFNLPESSILLLKSSLTKHTQFIKLFIDLSDEITDNHSVPQGIVLRSLNFLIKVNDFSEKRRQK